MPRLQRDQHTQILLQTTEFFERQEKLENELDLDIFAQVQDMPELNNRGSEALEESKINNGLDFSSLLTDDYF